MHSTLTNLQEWSTLAEANMFHSLPSPTISNTFNPLVKDLFIFPSWHLFAIGVKHIFSCRWNLPPVLRSSPKERDSRNKAPCTTTCTWHTGLEPSWMLFFPKSFHMHRCWSLMSRKQFKAKGPNSHAVFVHVHSPLLMKSHVVLDPPLTYMLKFSGWTYLMLPRQICFIRFLSNIPCSQDRLTHVQVLLTWNPSPLQFSKFWFEYFLLPPRPALGTQTHTRGFITRSCAPLLTDASICNSGQVSATGLSACEVIGQAVLLF